MSEIIKPPHAISLPYVVDGDCWLYIGTVNEHGYGRIKKGQDRRYAHRASWEEANGPIPDGIQVCHKCDNRLCINPEHLFLGTQTDNNNDMVSKGRQRGAKGLDNGRTLLSETQVLEIRQLYTTNRYSHSDLADQFDTSATNIRNIVNRMSWRHI